MSSVVLWRDANRTDRPALERFTCTAQPDKLPNGRRLPHPKPWEAEAQTGIRTRKPPGAADDLYRVGVAENGEILAVSAAAAMEGEEFPNTYKLLVLAVADSVRGGDGHVADDCMRDALRQITEHARTRGMDTVLVLGQIDPHNTASQRICARHEFTHIGDWGEYEVWARYLRIDEDAGRGTARSVDDRHTATPRTPGSTGAGVSDQRIRPTKPKSGDPSC